RGTWPNAGSHLDHRVCATPACCNPDHLVEVSVFENQQHRRAARRDSSTGVRNVHRDRDRWRVAGRSFGRAWYAGTYASSDLAERVAILARSIVHVAHDPTDADRLADLNKVLPPLGGREHGALNKLKERHANNAKAG